LVATAASPPEGRGGLIAIVSHPQDPHAQRVLELLARDGAETLVLNLSDLPDRAMLTFDYAVPGPLLEYRPAGGSPIDLRRLQAAWWRRPQPVDPATVTDHDVRLFTANEWHEALGGLWQMVPARWMNHPSRDEVASRKALQLRMAAEAGLRVPRTLITSDPDRARRFVEAHGVGRTIFKTFSCTHALWRETRLVRERDLALLETLRLAPVIFQEYVPAEADLRITIVGPRVFTAAIHSRDTDYPVDFRMSLGQARTEAAELPAAIAERLIAMMDRLGLVYGAVDMRRTPEGDYVFLEVNTAGEFLFVEERTGQPIARAVADWLRTPS
jgi:glutathione synthase/RimK-type ligase-like ATP-grasp enzyme